jgi:hypothetical protein
VVLLGPACNIYGKKELFAKFWLDILKEGHTGKDGRIILKWILKKKVVKV